MQYSEIIGVDKHFKSAFDITSDTGESWKTFISNEKFENNLNQIINAFTSSDYNKRNSIWIQGTYGTGKSHSLSVIKHLLSDKYPLIEDYLPKINKPQTRNNISNFRQSKRVYPVIMKGIYTITDVADLTFIIQQEVSNSLKHDGIEISTKTDYESIRLILENGKLDSFFEDLLCNNIELHSYASNKLQLMDALEKNEIKVLRIIIDELKNAGLGGYRTHNIVEWLKEIKMELSLQGKADYLMIIWDEFTSLLDIPARKSILNAIQDIAELSKKETSDATDTIGVYLLLVTHKKLEATESYKELKDDERNMAKARFIELDYDMQPTTTYHILSGALVRKDTDKLKELITTNMTSVASINNVIQKIIDETATNVIEVKDKIISLYPFHPYTSYLATFVSRVVGEAERSIFGFLNDEELGFKKYLSLDTENSKFLTADYVWDFFYNTFNSNSIGHFDTITNKFKLSGEVLAEKGQRFTEVFKVILLLNILYRVTTTDADNAEKSMVNPNTDNIISSFSGVYSKAEIEEVLDYLDDSQILHRSPDGIFEVTSSSLPQKRLLEEKQKLYTSKEDVSKIVEQYNISCLSKLSQTLTQNISREKEIQCFWGGEKEYTLRNKISAKFKVDYAVHIAVFLYRGETKELDTLLNRKETTKYDSKKMLVQLSKEEELKDIIFVSVDTELGNKKFEAYLDSIAQEMVARSLNMDEERQEGHNNAEKWIKQWITEIISSGYADLIFRGDIIHVPFSQSNKQIQDTYIPAIYKSGLDYFNAPNTAWTKQNSKSAVEKALYALNKTDLEKEAKGADSAIKLVLSDSGKIVFDESLSLILEDVTNPIVKVCHDVSQRIDMLKNEPSINLGKEFEHLTRPEFGYYQNRICMGVLALAFRPYIGRLYKSGNGQKVDKTVMKDIIVAMFDYWENGKYKDELIVRMSTEEERTFTEELNNIFELDDKDGLIETKWAIREKFKVKNKAPLWSLKYLEGSSNAYCEFIDKLFKFSKSTDENIQQNFIMELLDGIKTYKVELSQAVSSVESEYCLYNFIEKELETIHETSCMVPEVFVYLEGLMSGDVVFWEESDVHENILKWKISKDNQSKSKVDFGSDITEVTTYGGVNEGASTQTSEVGESRPSGNTLLREKVVSKISVNKDNPDELYKILLKVMNKYDVILEYLDQLLGDE